MFAIFYISGIIARLGRDHAIRKGSMQVALLKILEHV